MSSLTPIIPSSASPNSFFKLAQSYQGLVAAAARPPARRLCCRSLGRRPADAAPTMMRFPSELLMRLANSVFLPRRVAATRLAVHNLVRPT